MKSLRAGVSLVAVLFLAACVSTRQFVPFPDQSVPLEDPQKARIYLMRPTWLGSALAMKVSDGERAIGVTGPTAFLCWEREPGEVIVSSRTEFRSAIIAGESRPPIFETLGIVRLDAQQSRTYYIVQHLRVGGASKLELVEEAKGKRVLAKCHAPEVALK